MLKEKFGIKYEIALNFYFENLKRIPDKENEQQKISYLNVNYLLQFKAK